MENDRKVFAPNYFVHPGEILKDMLKSPRMSQTTFANKSGINKTIINEIIKGKRAITAEYAVKFERAMELPASFWMNLQSSYEEKVARLALENESILVCVESVSNTKDCCGKL